MHFPPSSTLYDKTVTKYCPALLCATLRLHKVLPSLLCTRKLAQSTSQYAFHRQLATAYLQVCCKQLPTGYFTQQAFTHSKLLQREAFTHRSFYTQKLLHREAFTQRGFNTQKLLHTAGFYTEKLLRREAFAHRNFYAQKRLRTANFHTEKPLHRETFTLRKVYAQKP